MARSSKPKPVEPSGRELRRRMRKMREDFYRRRGQEPPRVAQAPRDTPRDTPRPPGARRTPSPPRAEGPPPPDTKRGQMLAWLVLNGPGTAPQIAKDISAGSGEVNVGLLKLAKRGYTERTGRKIPSPNSRPHTEWRATDKAL